jgi:GGDEF domain-containing protein
MRLAFLDLPDDRVDLISLARQAEGVEIVLVAHPDPDALSLKIAEVLQIPRSTEPLDVLSLKPDQVALPSLDSPGAAALLRAGISSRIFTTLGDFALSLGGAVPDATGNSSPIDSWEAMFDEATGAKLGKIEEALALSEDRQQLFREVLALAVSQTGADAGSIMILDEEEGELRIAFAEGLSPDTVRTARQKLGEGVSGKVAREGKPLIINERISDPRFRDSRDRSRIAAAMSAPIQLDGRVIGVLNVSSDRAEKRFAERDLKRLTEIASQISAILERVVQGHRRDLDAVEFRARRAIEQAFARADLALSGRLRLVAARLASHLGAGAVQIYVADSERRAFSVIASGTAPGDEGAAPMVGGLLGRAFDRGESFFLAARLSRTPEGRGEATPNLVMAPLADARSLGVLAVECLERPPADLEELTRLITRLGRYIAQLASAGRDQGAATRQGLLSGRLSDIAPRLMVTHDLESLLTEAVGALRVLFGRGLVTARLKGRGDKVAVESAFEGPESDRDALAEIEGELAALALEQGTESSSAGSASEPAARALQAEFAVVPVRASGSVVGALGVALPPDPGAEGGAASLGGVELEALRKLALYVALAWEQARGDSRDRAVAKDPLTGLLGEPGLEARILDEVRRAERYHDRFLLTLCSVSGYERLEERHGADWAGSLLKELAQALVRNVREVDVVARIGGGRFAVLSPETDKDSGALLKRLDDLLPRLEAVRSLGDPGEVRLVGRQYTYPDEVSTGGEILALIRSTYPSIP